MCFAFYLDALKEKDLELKESCKLKEVTKETANKGEKEMKADVEAEVTEKMKASLVVKILTKI